MSKKKAIVAVVAMGVLAAYAGGCSAQAKLGTPEVKAATPPEPPATPPAPPEPPKAPEPPPPPPEPAKSVSRVKLEAKKIEITEQIQFDKGNAVIKEESKGLLEEIATLIKNNPDKVKKLSIEGHTSSDPDAKPNHVAVNQKLSDERAAAVKAALIKLGVEANKLSSKGFGESKPIGDNNDAGGRVKNRRVEFIITDPK
ncbi:MAG: OmpA family protein [Deltaproteobacteria bacterium]|nr:OmpA family protein [Deltaproteobacteria bacterium]